MSDQINVNEIANSLQTKVDLPIGTNQSSCDFVVESQLPTASNNYTWYRLYKSGWVEQGGKTTVNDATDNNVIFIIPMADTAYSFNSGQMTFNQSNAVYVNGWALTTYSETGFTFHSATNGTNTFSWEVKGMSA